MMKRLLILCLFLMACPVVLTAQLYPERKDIRAGNKEYKKKNYSGAEEAYLRAIGKNPASLEAVFNMGNIMYRQERYDEALQSAARIVADTTISAVNRAAAFYNAGNALFKQRKLEESLEAYKNSLRLIPDDMDAKFNYAYVKKLLEKDDENNDGGGGGGENDQDQDQRDQNQDQQQNQGQDQQQQPQGGMSQQEAEQMLDAMQRSEDNTKEKVDAQQARTAGARSGKNW